MRKLSAVSAKTFALFFVTTAFFLMGCPKPEQVAYSTAVGAKAFLDSLEGKHPECSTEVSTTCAKIARAVRAKDLLIDAGEIYCNGPDFATGGKCNPPDKNSPAYQQALTKLNAAVNSYKQAEADLKGAIGK